MADGSTGLGKLIHGEKGRDAVHVAIAPVTAAVKLYPGQSVDLAEPNDPEQVVAAVGEGIGIVDPFLTNSITPGQRFWLWMRPGSITSLRHEWTHPDLPDVIKPAEGASKVASETWLREFAEREYMSYDTLINAAIGDHHKNDANDGYRYTQNDGEYLHFGGSDAHGEIPPEFWNHVEIVTGRKIPGSLRASYFSCSC